MVTLGITKLCDYAMEPVNKLFTNLKFKNVAHSVCAQ